MRVQSILATTIFLFLGTSCGDALSGLVPGEEEESELSESSNTISGSFLSKSELEPSTSHNADPKDEFDLRFFLELESSFYDNEPEALESDDSTEEEEESSEVDACLDQFTGSKIKASETSLEWGVSSDLGTCFRDAIASADSEPELQVNKFLVTFFLKMTCDSVDLSSFDGLTAEELFEADNELLEDEECDNSTFLAESKFESDIVAESPFGTLASESVTISYQGDGNGGPCVSSHSDSETTFESGCVEIEKSIETSDDVTEEEFTRIEWFDIKADESSEPLWFISGRKDVIFDNWEGTVTYDGVDNNPAYEFTDNDTGDTASGTITPPEAPSLRLVQGKEKKQGHSLKDVSAFIQDNITRYRNSNHFANP